jgi:murein DD-endopeptidase MepM/ murein hydrolase activator NlpD
VSRAGWSDGYGNLIELRHQNGIVTRYGHLEAFARGIRVGNRVMQGETIGYVGSTGLATGPHLHYEFRINGIARDPRAVDLGSGDPIPGRVRPAFDLERARLAQLLDRPGSRPRPALVRAQAGE